MSYRSKLILNMALKKGISEDTSGSREDFFYEEGSNSPLYISPSVSESGSITSDIIKSFQSPEESNQGCYFNDNNNINDMVSSSGIDPENKHDEINSNIMNTNGSCSGSSLDESVDDDKDKDSVDDDKDKDFNIYDFDESSTDSSKFSENLDDNEKLNPLKQIQLNNMNVECSVTDKYNSSITRPQTFSEKVMELKKGKCMLCTYCDADIQTKNFARHLQRQHSDEKEVKNVFDYPKNSKARKKALQAFRNSTNFDLYINGTTRPNRRQNGNENITYYPCANCKGLYNVEYLKRHAKHCISQKSSISKNSKIYHRAQSQTVVACVGDPTNVISKLNIKNEVFDLMRGDEISLIAKKDLLIANYGESYLKSQKREKKEYTCSSRMRELARLLKAYRNIVGDNNVAFKDILHAKNFDTVVSAVREISGYDPVEKTFKALSLAMHLGNYLKVICDELNHLILKECRGFQCKTKEEAQDWRKNVKHFKELVQARWNTELSSLAHKNLQINRLKKPLLVPLVEDTKKFRDETLQFAEQCEQKFTSGSDTKDTYKLLVECALALLILFNRRRIGDVQYLKIEDYARDQKSCFEDFKNTLTDTEKMLTTKYKRVVNTGKGSRPVVILVPDLLNKLIMTLLKHRAKYISTDNHYVFAIPDSKVKWGQGDVAIRRLTKRMALKYPMAICSNMLRKHIATVMQILNLTADEAKQFSKFMGHTEKTHSEFYELPVDIYQTAKISKILLMMEKGLPVEYKGKSLTEINFDPDLEYAEYDETNSGKNNQRDNKTETTDESDDLDDRNRADSSNNKKRTYEVVVSATYINETSLKKKKSIKTGWTDEEIKLLEKEFETYIINGTYPPVNEIKEFIENNNLLRTAPVIKSKIQHLRKKKLN